MSEVKRIELPTGIQMEVEAIGQGDRPFVLVHGYTFDGLADDSVAALDQLGTDRCDLLGHSMGGAWWPSASPWHTRGASHPSS
ncbi:MAG: alpha/beta fold hydrolase [Planctomycetota bacterium]|jgi:pimeloyl-ACP methyl ester carboxylesterase